MHGFRDLEIFIVTYQDPKQSQVETNLYIEVSCNPEAEHG